MSKAGDPLTERQCELVQVIDQLQREQLTPPSLREIAEVLAIGFKAVGFAVGHIARKGGLTYQPGKMRTIQLTHFGRYQAGLPVCEVYYAR